MIASEKFVRVAAQHLSENDPILAEIIESAGLCTIRPHKNYYQELASSIISQQLSIKAASTIEKRFCQLFGLDAFPSPEQIASSDVDTLRSAGLSRGKASYIIDLAQHVIDGKLKFDHLDSLSNDEVIRELVDVKGIGEWTAHMFLMFAMGRLDILAVGDLGIKVGIQKLYGFKDLPTAEDITKLAKKNKWHPYETIACWYIWHHKDNL